MTQASQPQIESTILIVDDQVAGREVLRGSLVGQGYTLAFASSGPEALAQVAKIIPDLILLDVMMPGMDGFEVCQNIRQNPALAEIPILMITALDDQESRLRGLEVGADDFISKPFNRRELQARVHNITQLNRYRQILQERERRQKIEAEIARNEQEIYLLKESERIKNKFVSDVSHELRTPLSIITLVAGNLDSLYDQLEESKRREMVTKLRTHTDVLAELINQILTLSQLEAEPLLGRPEVLNLARLTRDEFEKQQPLAQAKEQIISLTGRTDVDVYGVEAHFRQIIGNVINNAIKYTPDNGTITCECQTHYPQAPLSPDWPGIDQLPPGRWAALRVTDTGIGISPEAQKHLFERFFRAQPQSNIPGTGLGLSIVQELVKRHKGFVFVNSKPEVGSTFAIYFPLAL